MVLRHSIDNRSNTISDSLYLIFYLFNRSLCLFELNTKCSSFLSSFRSMIALEGKPVCRQKPYEGKSRQIMSWKRPLSPMQMSKCLDWWPSFLSNSAPLAVLFLLLEGLPFWLAKSCTTSEPILSTKIKCFQYNYSRKKEILSKSMYITPNRKYIAFEIK